MGVINCAETRAFSTLRDEPEQMNAIVTVTELDCLDPVILWHVEVSAYVRGLVEISQSIHRNSRSDVAKFIDLTIVDLDSNDLSI